MLGMLTFLGHPQNLFEDYLLGRELRCCDKLLNQQGAYAAANCMSNAEHSFSFHPLSLICCAILSGTMPEERQKQHPYTTATRPFSLRLSEAERERLSLRAGRVPLGAYVRGVLFPANDNGAPPPRQARGVAPVRDHAALAQVLAKFGASDTASSLRSLARAAELGALPMTPETEEAIRQACRDVAEIKALLMTALGTRER